MPLNHIVGEVAERQSATLVERGNAPEESGMPDSETEPTNMNTQDGLPPHLHIQTLSNRSALFMVSSVLTLVGFAKVVMD